MSKGGRPANAVPTVKWDLYIRSDLAAQVELLLLDPMREKVKYGARGKLMEQLLNEWLEEKKQQIRAAGNTVPTPSPLARFLNALKFEISNWNLNTPEKIKELVRKEEADEVARAV